MRRTRDIVLARLRRLHWFSTRELAEEGPFQTTPFRAWILLVGLVCTLSVGGSALALSRGWPRLTPDVQASSEIPSELAQPRPLGGALEPTFSEPSVDASAAPSGTALILVHVVGPVRKPGVVSLPAGSRVRDAVAAAGGLKRGATAGPTNLARVLSDGERIEIGFDEAAAVGGGGGSAPGAARLVDLNTATSEQLDQLPGIGPVTAGKILSWRAANGRFTTIDELAEVPGIGPKTLEELRPLVRV